MAEELGEIIDLDAQVIGPRGQTAEYDDALTALIRKAYTTGKAARIGGKYTVVRAEYESKDKYDNAKQAVGAEIRKHAKRVIAEDGLTGKPSINWDPEGRPQVSLKG
jgi:hypothetical protein